MKTWSINPGVCILLLIYLCVFVFYIFHPWRCKLWQDPDLSDAEQKKRAYHFKSALTGAHTLFFAFLVLVPIVCSVLLLLQVYLPDYTSEIVVRSFARQEYKSVLDTTAISLVTPDSARTIPNSSFVAYLHSCKGIAYPTSPFLTLLFGSLFEPVWGFAWSCLVWIVVFLIAAWFAEFIGSITFHFK